MPPLPFAFSYYSNSLCILCVLLLIHKLQLFQQKEHTAHFGVQNKNKLGTNAGNLRVTQNHRVWLLLNLCSPFLCSSALEQRGAKALGPPGIWVSRSMLRDQIRQSLIIGLVSLVICSGNLWPSASTRRVKRALAQSRLQWQQEFRLKSPAGSPASCSPLTMSSFF